MCSASGQQRAPRPHSISILNSSSSHDSYGTTAAVGRNSPMARPYEELWQTDRKTRRLKQPGSRLNHGLTLRCYDTGAKTLLYPGTDDSSTCPAHTITSRSVLLTQTMSAISVTSNLQPDVQNTSWTYWWDTSHNEDDDCRARFMYSSRGTPWTFPFLSCFMSDSQLHCCLKKSLKKMKSGKVQPRIFRPLICFIHRVYGHTFTLRVDSNRLHVDLTVKVWLQCASILYTPWQLPQKTNRQTEITVVVEHKTVHIWTPFARPFDSEW